MPIPDWTNIPYERNTDYVTLSGLHAYANEPAPIPPSEGWVAVIDRGKVTYLQSYSGLPTKAKALAQAKLGYRNSKTHVISSLNQYMTELKRITEELKTLEAEPCPE